MTIATKKIQFNQHTVVDPKKVFPAHCGRLQLQEVLPAPGVDPATFGQMQYVFPAGTVLEMPDYVAGGHAVEVDQSTPEASPDPKQIKGPAIAPEYARPKEISNDGNV